MKEKGFILFRSSETGNYKIYSPENKMVFNNPFLLDKQLTRLDYFNLTNVDFYAIIKDYYRYAIRRIIETEQRINQYDFYREYNQGMKSFKQGLTNDLAEKYKVVKTEDQFYLNNHPSGIQEISLNLGKMKIHLDEKNFFTKPILDMLRLLPWYSNEKERSNRKQKLKRKKKGLAKRF